MGRVRRWYAATCSEDTMFRDAFYTWLLPVMAGVGMFLGLMLMEHFHYFTTVPTSRMYSVFADMFLR
ncbi:MAG: hypothetical protein ACI8PZ_003931 [Myxococcota bacterium]|jgi:hypothetical protein